MTLVVGATGMLGGEICRLLAERRKPVKALVRGTSSPEKLAMLKSLGAALVNGRPQEPPVSRRRVPGCERRHFDGVVDPLEAGRRLNRDGGPAGTTQPHRRCRSRRR